MNEQRTIARPYARAVFELAVQEQQLAAWSNLLALLSTVANDEQMQSLYQNPQCTSQVLAEIFISILATANVVQDSYKNFIYLLANYRRLALLPTIAALFEEDKAQLEKTLQVEVTSAFPISDNVRHKLKQALEIRLQRAVSLQFHQDKQLVGGAIIRAGDLVIDGSVRSKLDKLKQSLMN